MTKKIVSITLILAFSLNQLAGLGSAYQDTLRPAASAENTAVEFKDSVAPYSVKASSAGTSHSATDGLFRRVTAISVKRVDKKSKSASEYEKVDVVLSFQRVGSESEKENRVTLHCVNRGALSKRKASVGYAKTVESSIDGPIKRFIKKQYEESGILDLQIEDAEIGEGSMFTMADIAKIGIASTSFEGQKRAVSILHKSIFQDEIARFDVYAHMAFQKGYLTVDDLLACIPDDTLKHNYYTEVIDAIALLKGGGSEVANRVKFHYALEAVKAHRNFFRDRNKILIREIRSTVRKESSARFEVFLKDAKAAERMKAVNEVSGKGKEAIANSWSLAKKRYLSLNMFEDALRCKREEAKNWFLAYGEHSKDEDRKRDRSLPFDPSGKMFECLKKALELNRELEDEKWTMRCLGELGAYFYEKKEYEQSAWYYEKAAKLAEKIRRRKSASMYWAGAALSYADKGEYGKAGYCDKWSAEINLLRGEKELAMEHYVYASRNFEREKPPMKKEAQECMDKARKIDPKLFSRIDAAESLLTDHEINQDARNILGKLPELFTLLGTKPATTGFMTSGSIKLIKDMKDILNKKFGDDIGFIYRVTAERSIDDAQIWYCIYDKSKVRRVVRRHKNDLFSDKEVKEVAKDKGLRKFMNRIMNKKSTELILLGYPKRDVLNFRLYRTLLLDASVPRKEIMLIDPTQQTYITRFKNLRYKEKTIFFIRHYYHTIQAYYKGIRYPIYDDLNLRKKIGFNWISIEKTETRKKHAERYIAVLALIKMLIEEKPPEKIPDVIGLEHSDDYEPESTNIPELLDKENSFRNHKIEQAIASQA